MEYTKLSSVRRSYICSKSGCSDDKFVAQCFSTFNICTTVEYFSASLFIVTGSVGRPTLFIGESEHGFYALPAFVDESTVSVSVRIARNICYEDLRCES